MTAVLIDGHALYDGSQLRGIGEYVRQLVDHLAGDDAISLSALVTRDTSLPEGVGRELVRRFSPNRFSRREHALFLPLDIRRRRFDVYHSPAQHPPAAIRKPWVQTLHSIDDHPALAAEQRRWRRFGPRIRSAAAVIVATDHARDGVIDLMGLDSSKVHVVPFGVSPAFRAAVSAPNVDTPYLLYVGEYGPHKGYREAFEVISGLAERGFPHRLQVAGRLAEWHREEISRLLAVAKHSERVDLVGHVQQARLVDLYAGATAVVFTSRCEAFGFPLVEAMAMAVPVVAFDNTAIPSVLGDGGVTVPDGDVGAIVDAVAELITDAAFRNRVATAARHRSTRFDWDECAAAHKGIYAAAAGG